MPLDIDAKKHHSRITMSNATATALRAEINHLAATLRGIEAAAVANGRWTYDLVAKKRATKLEIRRCEFALSGSVAQ